MPDFNQQNNVKQMFFAVCSHEGHACSQRWNVIISKTKYVAITDQKYNLKAHFSITNRHETNTSSGVNFKEVFHVFRFNIIHLIKSKGNCKTLKVTSARTSRFGEASSHSAPELN